jgi:phosphoserine phosphatase
MRYLPALIGTCIALDQIYGRFMKMELKMELSENERVSFLAKFCSNQARSIIGGNKTDSEKTEY